MKRWSRRTRGRPGAGSRPLAKPERGEDERGRPALRALVQQLELVGLEVDPARSTKNARASARRERQLARPQLRELAAGTQVREA